MTLRSLKQAGLPLLRQFPLPDEFGKKLAVECSFFLSNIIVLVRLYCCGSAPAHCPTWPPTAQAQRSWLSVVSDISCLSRKSWAWRPCVFWPRLILRLLSLWSFLTLPSPATLTSRFLRKAVHLAPMHLYTWKCIVISCSSIRLGPNVASSENLSLIPSNYLSLLCRTLS